MVKKTNSTSKSDKLAKKSNPENSKKYVFLEEGQGLLTFKQKPVSEAFIERLADDYIDWAKKDDSFILSDFYDDKYIDPSSFYNWINKFKYMKDAHAFAKRRLASRREKGSLFRSIDRETVFKRQHAYCADWESDRQRDKQDKIDIAVAVKKAAMEAESAQTKVIVLSDLEYKKLEGKD